ncbi:hypothetical protein C8J56DRAFT_313495 [Mycena floridula]|nr:hypothetical protein C8J56DRAFT_313495 [Mycena floridula]
MTLCSFLLQVFLLQTAFALVSGRLVLSAGNANLTFSANWQASRNSATGSLFFVTDALGPALIAKIPASTTKISYVGLKRSAQTSSIYGVCIDCGLDDTSKLSLIDGRDPSLASNSAASPQTIFTLDVDKSSDHTLSVFNVANTGGTSVITFEEIILDTDDTATATTASETSAEGITTTNVISASTFVTTFVNAASSTDPNIAPSAVASPLATASGIAGPAEAAASTTADKTLSATIIAVIIILSLFGALAIGAGAFFYLRSKKRQMQPRISYAPSFVDRKPESWFDPDAMARAPQSQSQYAQNQYSQSQYSQNQYSQNQYSQNQYSQNQYPENQYSQNQYSQNQYSQNQYARNQYSQNHYPDAEDAYGGMER